MVVKTLFRIMLVLLGARLGLEAVEVDKDHLVFCFLILLLS
jgi:hypothetical protein